MTTDERLENLERELACAKRRNRWLLAVVGLALGAWVLAGTLGPRTAGAQAGGAAVNEVRAKSFLLVDDAGKCRAMLAVVKDGPHLALFDAAGMPRASLGVTADGPALSMSDAAGKLRAVLGVPADGPSLALCDTAGKPRAGLDVLGGEPRLSLYDAAGERIWRAP